MYAISFRIKLPVEKYGPRAYINGNLISKDKLERGMCIFVALRQNPSSYMVGEVMQVNRTLTPENAYPWIEV